MLGVKAKTGSQPSSNWNVDIVPIGQGKGDDDDDDDDDDRNNNTIIAIIVVLLSATTHT